MPISAQTSQSVKRVVSGDGTIQGLVQDDSGAPVAGALVTAAGASTVVGITDRFGHFTLRSLTPGPYLVRARMAGFAAPRAQIVQVPSSIPASSSIALHRLDSVRAGQAPPIVPASIGGLGDAPDATRDEPPAAKSADGGDTAKEGEIEWRLRHARRSILNEAVDQVIVDASSVAAAGEKARADRLGSSAARVATSFFAETPFFGQVNLLTTSSFDAPMDFFTTKSLASRSVANMLLGAPVGDKADWTVRGALTQGDIASWVVFGDYVTRAKARHRYNIGLSYSTQRYDGANFAALRNVTDGSRNVGTLHGFDTFAVTRALTVTYGARYGHYDYLDGENLLSPRAGVVFTPAAHVRLNALVSIRALAPGAEEFMAPTDMGTWLPPQRTFSSVIDGIPLVAERTRHVEAGLERDITARTTISVRAFSQHIDNQLMTLFGLEAPGRPPATAGHYFVANTGPLDASGYAAGMKTVIANRVRGSIEYSFARAERNPSDGLAYFVLFSPASQPLHERVHDISTSLETDVPETSTHVAVLCRFSDGFAPRELGSQSGLDARFDVQVRQALPFMDFSSAKWEMLIAVRNFFHDAAGDGSIYDELLVIHPPKRVVGGLTLRF
jgi:Carboxypeptidase regulatory-like domain/TonB dependent receptor